MKQIIFLSGLLFAASMCQGTKLTTTVVNSGVSKEVLGVVHFENRLLFSTYSWQEVEENWPAIAPKVLKIESDIPSVLIGGEIDYISSGMEVLYTNGKDLKNFIEIEGTGWINSKYLGWVYIRDYPYIYAVGAGWGRVEEIISDTIYQIYYYRSGESTLIDIHES